MNRKIAAFCGAVAFIAAACAPKTSLTKVWTIDNPPEQPMQRVMVLGLGGDQEVRKSFEASAAEALQEKGIQAVPAFVVLKSSGTPTKAQVQAAVKEANVDGVWVSRLIGEKEKTQVVPPESYEPLERYVAYGYDAMYASSYRPGYSPGYTYEYKVVEVETKVFEKDSGKLLWSGTSETEQAGSVNELIVSLSQAVTQDLKKKGLVSAGG